MIYNGDYTAGLIYGTLNRKQIQVSTTETHSFLVCELEANYLGEVWTHTFEIPFYNGVAQLPFNNYLHSLMTQKFNLQLQNTTAISVFNFDISAVTLTLTEKKDGAILDTHTVSFYMMLGDIVPVAFSAIESTEKVLLTASEANCVTSKAVLSFSYLSKNNPSKVIVNNIEYAVSLALTNKKLHTFLLPLTFIADDLTDVLDIKLEFEPGVFMQVGTFYITPEGTDHTLFAYQNQVGGISLIEFTGDLKTDEDIKSTDFNHLDNRIETVSTSKIEYKNTFQIKTGYVHDSTKYQQIKQFLRSFNIFIKTNKMERCVLNGTQKLNTYTTDSTDYNETLNFKKATNDDIYNGFF